jgi:hypothetical protein
MFYTGPLLMQRYENDVIAWANEQAAFIRAGRFDKLDLGHIADEIEADHECRVLAELTESACIQLIPNSFATKGLANLRHTAVMGL